MTASEQINRRLLELYKQAPGYHEAEADRDGQVRALEWALELVEAQEARERWTLFDDAAPPLPEPDDKRIVLLACECGPVILHATSYGIDADEWKWVDDDRDTIDEYHSPIAWRIINPPGVGGGV